MANPIGIWGIDIGQCALKALRLEMIDDRPTATAFDYIEHPKILSQPDADPDALTREALEKFLSRNPLGKDEVAVSVAGQSGLARFVKLPPVEEKKIGDIVKFEAKQQIPFPLEEVVWDYQKIAGGEAVGGFAMETEIGLFAMKRDVINKYLGHFQAVGAEVHYVQMAPLALCNYATYELLKKGGPDEPPAATAEGEDDTPRGKKKCTVVLDIGTDSSNLIITDGGKIIWQRPIPLGGNHFTRALTKELKLTFAKAEHLKRNAAKSPDLAQILRALRPVLTEFVGEVQRSLGYFTNTHRDAHVAHLVGLGSAFKLPGLQKYLSEKLSLDVKKPTKIERLSGEQVLTDPTFQENLLTFPVAYGLALQGLGLARLKTSLLPGEVRTERLIRAKKPAVAMAAAALLLGTGMLAIGYGAQLSSVQAPEIKGAIEKAESAVKLASAQASDITKAKGEIDSTLSDVKAIIVGNDERLNWIRLNEVLVAALPRHGDEAMGGNLTDPNQLEFWRTQEGQRAFDKFKERMAAGIPLEKIGDDDQAQHLATVQLEAVYARYTDNLGTFLTAADGYSNVTFAQSITEDFPDADREKDEATSQFKPKAIEGGGWVIELRGYTYHNGGRNFLRKALIQNLKKWDQFAEKTATEKDIQAVIPGGTDPVRKDKEGKPLVTHPFLLAVSKIDNPSPNQTRYSQSLIDTLMAGGGVAGAPGGPAGFGKPGDTGAGEDTGGLMAPGGMPGMPGAGGGGAAGWAPLTASGSGGAAGGMGGMMRPGMPGGGMPGMPGMPGDEAGAGPGMPPPGMPGMPGMPGGQAGPGGVTPQAGRKTKPRYDFVACFIWREPTPTDPTPAAGESGGTTAPTGGSTPFGQ
ncbi:MAG TPA: type IV pilus assembly protein PilM [Fimbriiglobus sp.]|jgi:type IV pilus assembly protein PilM|nr:type IV pilus assembly protein PilM [Fimbriiglobus sp.]